MTLTDGHLSPATPQTSQNNFTLCLRAIVKGHVVSRWQDQSTSCRQRSLTYPFKFEERSANLNHSKASLGAEMTNIDAQLEVATQTIEPTESSRWIFAACADSKHIVLAESAVLARTAEKCFSHSEYIFITLNLPTNLSETETTLQQRTISFTSPSHAYLILLTNRVRHSTLQCGPSCRSPNSVHYNGLVSTKRDTTQIAAQLREMIG